MTKLKAPKKKGKNGTSKMSAMDKKRAFVEAYLSNGGNLTQAALAAGYTKGGAAKAGYRLSKDVFVLSELDKRRAETLDDLKITTERILTETARLAFSDPRRIIHQDGPSKGKVKTLDELDDETAAAVASFKIDEYGRIEYKFWDKNSASERLFKQAGLYKADNDQKGDAVAAMLAQVAGSGFKPVK